MSLFQSALDFLAGPGGTGGASRDQNDFVGQIVELGDMKLRIKRVIAEGGFAFVYEAQDIGSSKDYALKVSVFDFLNTHAIPFCTHLANVCRFRQTSQIVPYSFI
uniref:Protein kinase domain-containing protein n=1 Tax=Hucho hucho TaxID=62062 RepID=A0A4W5J8W6_9TELE